MFLYIDKYTPNDSRTHDTTSWFVYGTPDISGIVPPLLEVLDSTDNLLSFKIPIELLTNKVWVVVNRNMSDGTFIQPATYVIDGMPTYITPAMNAPVEIPSIKVISNALDVGGDLVLLGSDIAPAYNHLSESFWSVIVNGKTTFTKKINIGNTVTFTSDEVDLRNSNDVQVTLIHRSLEGVSSHAGVLNIYDYEDTSTKLYGAGSIDPMASFKVRLTNDANILSFSVTDNKGTILLNSTEPLLPSAILSYSTQYRMVINYELNGVFAFVDTTIKTVSDQDIYPIDLEYTYNVLEPYVKYDFMLGTYFVDEAFGGFILAPKEETCLVADVSKGGESVGSMPHKRFSNLDFTKDYYVSNINNHMFMLYNGISVSVYDMIQDIRSFYKITEIIIDSMSNITSFNGYIYYIDSSLNIMKNNIRGGDPELVMKLPEFLNPEEGKFGIVEKKGYLYITGPLDALLRYNIRSNDFDYLQALPSRTLSDIILLKNHDFILVSENKLNLFKYNFSSDTIEPFPINGLANGFIRNLDGSLSVVFDNGRSEIYY